MPESRVEEALAGLGALREKNTETGYRFELRRGMSETLNGSIGFSSSKRTGSDWTNLSTLDPTSVPANSALNTYLINTYCGGNPCYGQVLPASRHSRVEREYAVPDVDGGCAARQMESDSRLDPI